MLHRIAGSEAAWRARPFVSQSNCFVVPPMKFATDALECLRVAVEGGMPVLLLSAGQAGATTPACLAGAVSKPGRNAWAAWFTSTPSNQAPPAILGTWPFVSDLRTGAMSGGSPEQALLCAACAQVGLVLDLPFGTACGMSDAKFPDFQAGAERASAVATTALAGANIIYESAGMYASLLGTCPESLLLDNDVLGAALRITRGIEVNPDTLSFDEIKQVCTRRRRPLPRLRQDPAGHAKRVHLPGLWRPPKPQRLGGSRQAGDAETGHRAQTGNPQHLLPKPRQRRSGRRGAGQIPHSPAPGGDGQELTAARGVTVFIACMTASRSAPPLG